MMVIALLELHCTVYFGEARWEIIWWLVTVQNVCQYTLTINERSAQLSVISDELGAYQCAPTGAGANWVHYEKRICRMKWQLLKKFPWTLRHMPCGREFKQHDLLVLCRPTHGPLGKSEVLQVWHSNLSYGHYLSLSWGQSTLLKWLLWFVRFLSLLVVKLFIVKEQPSCSFMLRMSNLFASSACRLFQ